MTKISERIAELYDEAERIGKWTQAAVALDHERRIIRARLTLEADGKSMAERDAQAMAHPDYAEACKRAADAEGERKRLDARHRIALAAMSVWQTAERTKRTELSSLPGQT